MSIIILTFYMTFVINKNKPVNNPKNIYEKAIFISFKQKLNKIAYY